MAATRLQFLVSASRLSDGGVVYLHRDRRWVESFDEGWRHDDAASRDGELVFAKSDEAHVCNAHVVEVGVAEDGALRLSARERFRREGAAKVRVRLGYERPADH
ncbi:MAG: DUF2849 domain-containing protein [Sandaracinaceae bacterium]|nr:DUF2849 domain-containing protein [Sandaracinaceae bacterium]